MSDPDLLPPSVDPGAAGKIGIRKLTAHNAASARTVITVRDHQVITDEAGAGNTGPSPLENTLASLAGCEGVIINRCAEAMGFKYSAVDMAAEGDEPEVSGRVVTAALGENNRTPANTFTEKVAEMELDLICDALRATGGNQRASAESLGLTYDQFRHLYKKYKVKDMPD